jgi:hypothetical protein
MCLCLCVYVYAIARCSVYTKTLQGQTILQRLLTYSVYLQAIRLIAKGIWGGKCSISHTNFARSLPEYSSNSEFFLEELMSQRYSIQYQVNISEYT